MQVRHNADICHAAGTDSAYYFGLCYFGIDVREKNLCTFKFHNGNFALEVSSIEGSIRQRYTYLYIAGFLLEIGVIFQSNTMCM